jgi:hypothetical protein
MVVLVELRRGDLQTSTKAEMVWLGKWKGVEHESRRQELFLFAVQRATRPKLRVSLDHRPDFSLDPVSNAVLKTIVRPKRWLR